MAGADPGQIAAIREAEVHVVTAGGAPAGAHAPVASRIRAHSDANLLA